MRGRRRQLVGFSVAAVLLLAAAAGRCAGRDGAREGDSQPRLPEPEAVRRAEPRPTERVSARPTTPTPTATPTRSRRRRIARLRRPLLRPLGGRGDRRAEPRRRRRRRCPRLRRAGAAVAEHVHEVENDKLGWREPMSDGRRRRATGQDRHLPLRDRRRTVRLRRPRPRPGEQGAPAATAPARLPRPRQRLQRFRVPGHEGRRGPPGDARPRVQPHPPVRLRRLSGPLVRRVERDLDGGPGLQRHRRLPALRAALGQALGHAADDQLDQGVRLGGLERVAGPPLRRRGSSARPGRGRSTPGPAASRSPPTKRRSAPPGARPRPRLHPLRRRRRRVAHRRGLPRERPLPGHAAAGLAGAAAGRRR